MKALVTLTLTAATAACAWKPTPVVMVGPAEEISALVGEWSGEYSSRETQRSGTIWFKLEAGRDTAYGDVLMLPRETVTQMMPEATAPAIVTPAPRVLTIKFVRVNGQRITGAIEPYPSPDCECLLLTLFRGQLKGDRVEGEFVILHSEHNSQQQGTWWATRHKNDVR